MNNFNLRKFLTENKLTSNSVDTYSSKHATKSYTYTVNVAGATPQQLALIEWEDESYGWAFPIPGNTPPYNYQFYADEIMKLNSEEEVRDYYKNKRKESHTKKIGHTGTRELQRDEDGYVKYFDGLDHYGHRSPISRAVKVWRKASKKAKPVPQPETGDPKYLKVAKKLTDMYKSTPQGRKIIMGTKPFRKDGTDDVQALILSADQYLEYFEERGDEDGVEIANYFLNSLGDLEGMNEQINENEVSNKELLLELVDSFKSGLESTDDSEYNNNTSEAWCDDAISEIMDLKDYFVSKRNYDL